MDESAAATRYLALAEFVEEQCNRRLRAYEAHPRDAREHFETENEVLSGGYAYRQLYELIQNAADAVIEAGQAEGRIQVTLFDESLEVANTGAPLDEDGVDALLNARSSPKRGDQIGRFGIGFKSLLKFGGCIDIVSRSIGLRFEPDACRARIRRHLDLPDDARAPGMRLAEVLDPDASSSPLSPAGRYEWAQTVVSATIPDPAVSRRVENEIQEFPGAFLLFLPADIEIEFVIEGKDSRRVAKRVEDGVSVVHDGNTETRWKVFAKRVTVNDAEALSEATHVHRRDEVPLTWAVPLGGREQAGRFWAFFPTETRNLTTGILNAPWKLNSDRTHLIRGAWNNALMVSAAELVAESLPAIVTAEDYATPLSAFPRQPDSQDEIAVPFARALWDRILKSRSVPVADCRMRKPVDVKRHFIEDRKLCSRWSKLAGSATRTMYLHPDCYRYQNRLSRINALYDEAERRNMTVPLKVSVEEWLEPLGSLHTERAKQVIYFVGELLASWRHHKIWSVPQVPLIPASTGALVEPSKAIIATGVDAPPGFLAVDREIVSDSRCKQVLVDHMQVREFSPQSWLSHLEETLEAAEESSKGQNWEKFWHSLGTAPTAVVRSFIDELLDRENQRLKFRARSGSWANRNMLLVVDQEVGVDAQYTLDTNYLANLDVELPRGWLTKFPSGTEEHRELPEDLQPYRRWIYAPFRRACQAKVGSTPQYTPQISPYAGVELPAGWRLLPHLPLSLKGHLTLKIIRSVCNRSVSIGGLSLRPVRVIHPTRPDVYPEPTAPHPLAYWLTKHGHWVFPIEAIEPAVAKVLAQAEIPGFSDVLAFFDMRDWENDLGHQLEWPTVTLQRSEYERLWNLVFEIVGKNEKGFDRLRGVWEAAFSHGVMPAHVPTADGKLPLREIFISTDSSIGDDLDDGRVVILSRECAQGWIEAGGQPLPETKLSFRSLVAEPARLLEMFPELAISANHKRQLLELSVVEVDGLEQIVGPHRREKTVELDSEGTIFIDRKQFSEHSWSSGLKLLVECLARHRILHVDDDVENLIERILDRRSEEARKDVRAQPDLPSRLLRSVGYDTEALRALLEPPTLQALGDDASAQRIAELSLAVHGPAILSRLRETLAAQGLDPPKRWGGEEARTFVVDLGFPLEFASTASGRRDAELAVNGPIKLPRLHDYQQEILRDIERLLASGIARRRAVVSLPTGGGKTRVAAEAVVRFVLRADRRRSVLWIAQTDELCEQAVQCFRQLWVNVGALGEDLRIVRLWGGQRNPPPSENDEAVVVVASIQTLTSRRERAELGWVGKAGIIIIDECHHAIASSYSDLLRWLDLQVGTEPSRDLEPPLLGLSATPWRGYDEEESERLAARFDRRWFPADQAGLHDRLSAMGVISERSYRPLRYDRRIRLTKRERQHVEIFGELPESVIERLGKDENRNELVVRAVLESSAESILLFANSVAHAQYLAARLHLAGCPAAAVSGGTDRLARQHFTRKFRSGSLRVICNHSVLTTGFDAPKCDMIVVSRPVFSPVRYMQMVGRGLRGPANGGTRRCKIVTVEDNILNYRDRLAYHFCKRYFGE